MADDEVTRNLTGMDELDFVGGSAAKPIWGDRCASS